MEPLVALSLASSVAQFLEFGTELFRGVSEIAGAGSMISVSDLRHLGQDLEKINSTITRHSDTLGTENLTDEERSLCDLAHQCSRVTKELLDCLDTLIIKNGQKKRAWSSIKAAFKTIWSMDRIEAISKRLAEFRSQLTIRLLLVLNMNRKLKQSEQGDFSQEKNEIVEAVSINYHNLRDTLDESRAAILSAILTTRDGGSIGFSTRPRDLPSWSRNSHDLERTTIMFSKCGKSVDQQQQKTFSPGFITIMAEDCSRRIVDSLYFRGFSHRRETIPRNHNDTFDWAWRSKPSDCRQQSLRDWLENGSGCFWISGKAGSGKSSFMRYLQDDRRTSLLLSNWVYGSDALAEANSGKMPFINSLHGARHVSEAKVLTGGSSTKTATLITGSFYFWYAGSSLQKSQAGLLRSLLHDVLVASPSLAPVLFPDMCRSIISGAQENFAEISFEELKLAFGRLVESVPEDLRICFFIDGVDEYVGDHDELCTLFASATESPRIKIVVSSRPISACVANFGNCPSLHLQDLTRHDIKRYVSDTLGANSLMSRMEAAEKGSTARLVENIVSKASGVFLWVVLVTRKVILGLQNYDSISDLESEIEKLPSDLANLYDHMLGSMSEHGRILGSKYLQLLLRNMEVCENYPMTLLQLSFAEQDDCTNILESPYHPLTTAAESWRCENTEGRLRSRCCGLVEVQGHLDSSSDDYPIRNRTIGFFHRTVVEFLRLNTIWDRMLSLTSDSFFEPDIALVASALMELRAVPIQQPFPLGATKIPEVSWRLCRFLTYGEHVSAEAKSAFASIYLIEIMKTLQWHWYDPKLFESPTQQLQAVRASSDLGCNIFQLSYPKSFIFTCGIRSTDWKIFDHLKQVFFTRYENFYWYTTCLLIQYMEERDPRMKISIAKTLMNPYVHPNSLIELPFGIEKLWKQRLVDNTKTDATTTSKASIWECILIYAYSVTHLPDLRTGFDYTNNSLVRSFIDLIIGSLNRGADMQVLLVNETKSAPTDAQSDADSDAENIQVLSTTSILQDLCLAIRSKTMNSGRHSSELHEIGCQLEELEAKCRISANLSNRNNGSETSQWLDEFTTNTVLDDSRANMQSVDAEQDNHQDSSEEPSPWGPAVSQPQNPKRKYRGYSDSAKDTDSSEKGIWDLEASPRSRKRVAGSIQR